MLEISSSVSVFWSLSRTSDNACKCNAILIQTRFFPLAFILIEFLYCTELILSSSQFDYCLTRVKTSNIPEEHWSTSSKSKFYQVVCCMYSSIELSFIKHSVGLYWRVNILTAIKTQTIEFMIESRTKESIQSVLHARSLIWKVRPKRTWTIRIHVCLFIFLYFIELGY